MKRMNILKDTTGKKGAKQLNKFHQDVLIIELFFVP